MSFAHADAYVRRWPFLSKLVLPRGAIDLVRDIPARDVTLVAPIASLVAREDIHPALIDILLQTATEVHGPPGLFQRAGEFPNSRQVDFPLSPDADRFYQSGRRFLQRYLPFWAATLVDRMLVLLIPLFALVDPALAHPALALQLAGALAHLQVVRPAQVPGGGVAQRSRLAPAGGLAEGDRRARDAREPHPHAARVTRTSSTSCASTSGSCGGTCSAAAEAPAAEPAKTAAG